MDCVFTLVLDPSGGKVEKFNFFKDENILKIEGNNYIIRNRRVTRFSKDQSFFENEKGIVVFDGVLLNREDFFREGKFWGEVFLERSISSRGKIINKFRGSYFSCVYHKIEQEWIIFSDHIGSKPVFYSLLGNGQIIVGASISAVREERVQRGFSVSLSDKGAYLLLTYGFTTEEETIIKEIKRIKPGSLLRINENGIKEEQYYKITNIVDEGISMGDAVRRSDDLFRQAIKRAFEKDVEHGYKHIASLSGGLDSRMTVVVSHEMGYNNQLNLTFSESDYYDETIPKEIARDLKHEWLFKALDNGGFLKEIDATTKVTEGRLLYSGAAHSNSLYELMNFNNLGMLHTGQLGDSVTSIGVYPKKKESYVGTKAYNPLLLDKLKAFSFDEVYENDEIHFFHNRAFSGANSGLSTIQKFTETYSPFYDVDYLDFCMQIPVKLRENHNLYRKWMSECYPVSCKYKWEKTRAKVDSIRLNYKGKSYPVEMIVKVGYERFLEKILKQVNVGMNSRRHMNPIAYWYGYNTGLKNYLDEYYSSHIDLIYEVELRNDCKHLFKSGGIVGKIQVLSLLASIKLHQL